MAYYHNKVYHEDNIPKRPLTHEDLQFLIALQREMNTQDTMGQADPRFWVIKGEKTVPADSESYDPEDGDEMPQLFTGDGTCIAATLRGAVDYFKENPDALHDGTETIEMQFTWQDENTVRITYRAPWQDSETTEVCSTLTRFAEILEELNIQDIELQWIKTVPHIYSDTLFLVQKDADDHLQRYGYNYDVNAHPYAMTAQRSPSIERLYELLHTIDFEKMDVRPTVNDFQLALMDLDAWFGQNDVVRTNQGTFLPTSNGYEVQRMARDDVGIRISVLVKDQVDDENLIIPPHRRPIASFIKFHDGQFVQT